jgi:chlorophyllide a reductase subunit Z
MDKVESTPARVVESLPWQDDAKALLDELVEAQPVLIRISAAKRLRDRAEREARRLGDAEVTVGTVERVRGALAGV